MKNEFRNQFLVTHAVGEKLQMLRQYGFSETRLLGLTVYHCPNLPVRSIRMDSENSLLVLGWMFNKHGQQVSEKCFSTQEASLQSIRESYFGRYLGILCNRDERKIFTDPAATLSAFITTDNETIVSTEQLALKSGLKLDECNETRQCDALCRSEIEYWYPMGRGRFANLRLLQPNHVTDLRSKKSVRIWPQPEFLRLPELDHDDFESQLTNISEFLLAAASLGRLVLPITAGRDSRILLAGILKAGLSNECVLYTNGEGDNRDVLCGRTLAGAFSLDWTNEGNSLAGVCIPGFGGEIVKGYWDQNLPSIGNWRDRVRKAIPFSELVQSTSVVSEELERWLDGALTLFSDNDPRILDLAYLELRWAATMGQINYIQDAFHGLALTPFAHPEIVNAGFHLPQRVRSRMSYWESICKIVDPILTILPAGIPQFSRRKLPATIARLLYAWAGSHRLRTICYSRPYLHSLLLTLRSIC